MKTMSWSIYKNSSLDISEWQECHVAMFIDRDIDASPYNRVKFLHDGFYPVYFEGHSTVARVVDGKFADIEELKKNIGEIVEKADYWGTYIEGFEKRNGNINVMIGS